MVVDDPSSGNGNRSTAGCSRRSPTRIAFFLPLDRRVGVDDCGRTRTPVYPCQPSNKQRQLGSPLARKNIQPLISSIAKHGYVSNHISLRALAGGTAESEHDHSTRERRGVWLENERAAEQGDM
ncbi:hypothetical protein DPEC_G00292560 [Dallia pectoralis]|uniref:Uncharacterized protein n=1 Tax=Dallia pectoralis TaxID=75939 RepID=A0ACC2FI32_DALPE|nr:hypothetical protein DPEC_G00292560 [Dallia pectoralis]